jgi:transcriptional regulator with XRE-family HTH domain
MIMTYRKGGTDFISPERLVFAERVKARRNELSFTQVDIHERSGLAVSYISSLENAEANTTLEIMASLARALDVNISYFFKPD